MKQEHVKLMLENGITTNQDSPLYGRMFAYELLVDILVNDNNRLGK